MAIRILTDQMGSSYICCVTPFVGQRCPDCKTVYDMEAEFSAEWKPIAEPERTLAPIVDVFGVVDSITSPEPQVAPPKPSVRRKK